MAWTSVSSGSLPTIGTFALIAGQIPIGNKGVTFGVRLVHDPLDTNQNWEWRDVAGNHIEKRNVKFWLSDSIPAVPNLDI